MEPLREVRRRSPRLRRRLARASAELPREALRFLGHARRRRGPPAGAQPGTLVLPPEAPRPRLRLTHYDADGFEERVVADVEDLAPMARGGPGVAWVEVEGFGDEACLRRIGELFDIHPLAIADAIHVPQRAKVEGYGDRVLLLTHMARLVQGGQIDVEQVSLVLGPGWVVSFQERPGDVFDPVRARIRSQAARIRNQGADYLAYALLDAVVDGYFPVVEALGEALDAVEEELVAHPSHASLARVHALRRTLIHLHRIQWRQRDALASVLRDEELPFSPGVRVYLRDVHDHAFQIVDSLESQREMSVSLMELQLSSASNRLNEVMRTLTVMATIFIPLTFLAGVYGMNFDFMPELHWRWAYPAVWAVMLGTAVGLLLWFRQRGWLGGGEE